MTTAEQGPLGAAPTLVATAQSLWPGALVEQIDRADRVHRKGVGGGEHYALVPSARNAQLLVPIRPTAAASSAVRRFSSASSGRDVVRRLTAAGVNRATRGTVLRDRVLIQPGPDRDVLRDHLGQVLGGPVDFAIGVGSARVNRKPVLQVFDPRGRTIAFAKIGDSAQARSDVAAETVALRRLEGHRFELLEPPRVLDASCWNGMEVLVVSPLSGAAPLRADLGSRPPLAAMGELATAFGETRSRLGELAWWRERFDAVLGLTDLGLRTRLVRCLAVLAERHERTVVEVGAWHGDWTPWNMARRRSRVLLWDWERFETGVPAGLDAWHHRVQTSTRALGLDVAVVLSALQRAGADGGRLGLVADLYLVAIASRYAALVHAERGADIAWPSEVMVRALEVRVLGRRRGLRAVGQDSAPRGR